MATEWSDDDPHRRPRQEKPCVAFKSNVRTARHVAAPSKSSQRTARPVTIVSRMFGKLRSSPGRSATATWRAKREIKCVSQPTVKDDLCSAASAAMTSRRGDLELARARNSARAGWQRRGQRRGREEAELERRRMARVPGGRPSAPAGSARKRSRRSAASASATASPATSRPKNWSAWTR